MRAPTETSSKIALFALSVTAMACAMFALFLGMMLSNSLDSSNFDLNPAIVPRVRQTARALSARTLSRHAYTPEEFEDFTKKLVSQYVVARYTINGSAALMGRALGIYDGGADNPDGGVVLKLAGTDLARGGYTDSYLKFASGADGEKAEILKLMDAGATRSVRILKGPYRYKDRWIAEVEFIIRTPSAASLKEAGRLRYAVHMEVEELRAFRSVGLASAYATPFAFFGFQVNWVERRAM